MPSRKVIFDKLKVIVLLSLPGFCMTYFVCTSCRSYPLLYLKISIFTACMWVFLWMGNEFLSHYLDTKISWMVAPLKRAGVGLLAMTVYTVSIVFVLAQLFQWLWDFSLGDDLISSLYLSVLITLVITLFMTSRAFLFNWKDMAVDAEKHQKESAKAQYDALRNQVNPHFLFNSLNVLTNLVYTDQDKAALFIKKMADVYRFVLDTRERELVDLSEEIKFAESYIYLQQIRFGKNLIVLNDIGSIEGKVIPLAIQMLIENAIKHNEISDEHPLVISLSASENMVLVSNMVMKKNNPIEKSSGVGLDNIKSRYEFLSDQKLIVVEQEGKFEVKVPILKLT